MPFARIVGSLAIVLAAILQSGCGYTLRPPYSAAVRTVYVPIFRSISYRRDLNLQLTEAVVKKIRERTPYVPVGKPEQADSTLEGVLTFADKNVIVENPNNLPRQINATINVAVTWTDNRVEKKATEPVVVSETVSFVHEVGESSSAGFTKAIDRLADQIVNMMEEQW